MAAKPPCKHRRCAFKTGTPSLLPACPPQPWRRRKGENFIRLHLLRRLRRDKQVERKRNDFIRRRPRLWRDKQARLLEFGEDVPASLHYAVARKKRLRLLSSAFVKTTADKEEKPCSSRRSPQGRRGGIRHERAFARREPVGVSRRQPL